MSDDELELTDEERALLEAEAAGDLAEVPEVTEVREVPEVPEAPVVEAKPKAKGKTAPKAKDADVQVENVLGDPAIPAQMTYDEGPWGLLPVQMRHDADGNPVK